MEFQRKIENADCDTPHFDVHSPFSFEVLDRINFSSFQFIMANLIKLLKPFASCDVSSKPPTFGIPMI